MSMFGQNILLNLKIKIKKKLKHGSLNKTEYFSDPSNKKGRVIAEQSPDTRWVTYSKRILDEQRNVF
jgi:hypothetical protein